MSQDPQDTVKLRSDSINEIISRPPGSLIRWGLSVVAVVFAIILLLSLLIHYPDVLQSDVTLTTYPAPINLVSRISGKIRLLQRDGSHLTPGEPIAYIVSNAELVDVLLLDSLVKTGNINLGILSDLHVGEMRQYVNNYVERMTELQTFASADLTRVRIMHLRTQASHVQNLTANLKGQQNLMKKELEIAVEKYEMDSTLYTQSVISRVDYNSARSTYVSQQRAFKNFTATIINNEIHLDDLQKQITELEIDHFTRLTQLKTSVDNAMKELSGQIEKWKQQYVFASTLAGIVVYPDFVEDQQYVESGKPIVSIIPDHGEIFGKLTLPIAGSGKVKIGQIVNIKLSNYPVEQFGMLVGKIDHISALPNGEKYSIRISLPEGMTTSYHHTLPFQQQLQGRGEIITENMSLLKRIFYHFNPIRNRIKMPS